MTKRLNAQVARRWRRLNARLTGETAHPVLGISVKASAVSSELKRMCTPGMGMN
ncbi:hypothetical protein IIA28_15285 [candidate division KSB1 bacterium]|nr:hypothetical protein [candidate division KSB1 bacterium]